MEKNETKIYNELRKQGVPEALLIRPEKRLVTAGNQKYDMNEMTDEDLLGYLDAFKSSVNSVQMVINNYKAYIQDADRNAFYKDMKQAHANLTHAIKVFEAEKDYRRI